MYEFIHTVHTFTKKKNDNKTKKNPEAHCQIYIKKNVEGEKLKNKNKPKKTSYSPTRDTNDCFHRKHII